MNFPPDIEKNIYLWWLEFEKARQKERTESRRFWIELHHDHKICKSREETKLRLLRNTCRAIGGGQMYFTLIRRWAYKIDFGQINISFTKLKLIKHN